MPIDQNKIQVQAQSPNIQTVQPVKSMGPEYLSAVGGALLQGYGAYETARLYKDSEDIQSEFVDNVALINKGESLQKDAIDYLDQAGLDNPRVAALRKEYESLDTAVRQRKDASLLYALKAEQRLKESLRRTPGLRDQLTATAAKALGVNVENYAIRTLIGNIDDEYNAHQKNLAKAGAVQKADLSNYHSIYNKLTGIGMMGIPVEDTTDTVKVNEATNKMNMMFNQVQAYDREIDNAKLAFENNQITQKELATQAGSILSNKLMLQVAPVTESMRTVGMSIRDPKGLKGYMEEIVPAAQALRNLIIGTYDQASTTLSLGTEGRQVFNAEREAALSAFDRTMSQLTNMENFSQVQTYGEVLKVMSEDLKLGFIESHETTAYLMENMPGLMNAAIQSGLFAAPDAFLRLGEQLTSVIKGSEQAPKGSALKGVLTLLQRDADISQLSDADKAKTVDWSLKLIEEKQAMDKADGLTDHDFSTLAGVMSQGFQFGIDIPDDRLMKLADIASSDVFTKTMDYLEKEGSWSSMYQRKVLGENALLGLSRAMEKGILPKAQRKGGTFGLKDESFTHLMTFNMTTGELSGSKEDKPVASTFRGVRYEGKQYIHDVNQWGRRKRMTEDAANSFNQYADTVYHYREFDPVLKDLSREQINYMLASQFLGRSDIKFVGERPKMPEPVVETADSYVDTRIKDTRRNIEDLVSRGAPQFLEDHDFLSTKQAIEEVAESSVEARKRQVQLAREKSDFIANN